MGVVVQFIAIRFCSPSSSCCSHAQTWDPSLPHEVYNPSQTDPVQVLLTSCSSLRTAPGYSPNCSSMIPPQATAPARKPAPVPAPCLPGAYSSMGSSTGYIFPQGISTCPGRGSSPGWISAPPQWLQDVTAPAWGPPRLQESSCYDVCSTSPHSSFTQLGYWTLLPSLLIDGQHFALLYTGFP